MKDIAQDFVPLEAIGNAAAPEKDAASRRRFLELMGASLAMAGAAGCTRQPPEFIMPYVEAPERAIPGRPSYYATANIVNGLAEGIVVESHLGRPTKVEGNPTHPASLGATGVHGQACVLDLYDPDRAKQISEQGETREWGSFLMAIHRALDPLRRQQGDGLYILTEAATSPTLGAQISALLAALPNAKWRRHDPVGPYSARAAAQAAFGRAVNTYYRLDRAAVILALDSDFLACGPASTRYAHDYALGRRVRGASTSMNRLYSVESEMTSTGGKAEHRLPLRYSQIEPFARALASAVTGGGVPDGTPHARWISAVARDLMEHRGACAIIPGDCQPPAVHLLAHTMNASLGNIGNTVIHTDPIEIGPDDPAASLRQLVEEIDSGKVQVLLMLAGNPVYTTEADIDFASRLAKVPTSIHLTLDRNETSQYSRWVIPERHLLEDWGDARAFDGTVTILQPLIQPLYESRSAIEVLDAFLQQPARPAYDIVRAHWSGTTKSGDFEQWWRQAVRTGVVPGSALPPISASPGTSAEALAEPIGSAAGIEVLFRPDPYLLDGRYANNAWLMELPRPVTKLTWDNAVHLSPRTAKRLGLETNRLVELQYNGHSVRGPVWVSPGQADETAVVHLGFGRTHAGHVGNGAGFNAYRLRTWDSPWVAMGAGIRALRGSYKLATVQSHQSMEQREIVISEPVSMYLEDPDFVQKRASSPPEEKSLFPPWPYNGYSWGMSVDLTACVNCMACVIACQAENNIPVVGKEQVLVEREMHWLRVDTYYDGHPDRPTLRYQPVPCMHCEKAPCELVCPVAATTHSQDGLNEMTYNRCIGTRYCSNNCPYKVRRFNYLLFNDWQTEQLKLQRNPDVTVRSRGVMEKCTYCVQRIREAEIRSEVEDRHVRDGEIQTACQQVCPTQAIVFGDINNPSNHVSKLKAGKLNYSLLGELNTRPRTTYLAELRNPNPALKESEWD